MGLCEQHIAPPESEISFGCRTRPKLYDQTFSGWHQSGSAVHQSCQHPLCRAREVQVQGDAVRLPVELSEKQEQSWFIKQEASMDEDFRRTVL